MTAGTQQVAAVWRQGEDSPETKKLKAEQKKLAKEAKDAEKKANAKPVRLTMFGVNPILCAAFASEASMS